MNAFANAYANAVDKALSVVFESESLILMYFNHDYLRLMTDDRKGLDAPFAFHVR